MQHRRHNRGGEGIGRAFGDVSGQVSGLFAVPAVERINRCVAVIAIRAVTADRLIAAVDELFNQQRGIFGFGLA